MRSTRRATVALSALALAAALTACSDDAGEQGEPTDDGPVGTSPLVPSNEGVPTP